MLSRIILAAALVLAACDPPGSPKPNPPPAPAPQPPPPEPTPPEPEPTPPPEPPAPQPPPEPPPAPEPPAQPELPGPSEECKLYDGWIDHTPARLRGATAGPRVAGDMHLDLTLQF